MFRARVPRRVFLASAAGAAATTTEKPSIYSTPDAEILLIETHSELENQIGSLRRTVTAAYDEAHTRVQGVVSKWISVEHAVESRVKSLIDPTEPLTPGALYVGIATLTGSILARNRILPARLLLPPTLLLLSMNHFLPKTSSNISEYGSELEERYLPTLAQKHAVANAHTLMTWEIIKDKTKDGREGVTKAADGLVGRIQDLTGLKIKESLGWGERIYKQAETRASEGAKAIQAKAAEAKAVIDEKVEGVEGAAKKEADEVKRLV